MIAVACRNPHRVLFAMAGSVVLTALVLGVVMSPWFLALAAFAALSQITFAATGHCPASLGLRAVCARTAASR